MGFELDERQRAMLQEMGVPVWLPVPAPAVAPPPEALRVAEALARPVPASAPTERPVAAPAVARAPVAAPSTPAVAAAAPAVARPPAQGVAAAAVVVGEWRLLYPADDALAAAPGWLILAESPGDDLLAGDAGRLLDNMLRAAKLHQHARVWGAAVSRGTADAGVPVPDGLRIAVAQHRPTLVLAMGRLAAQAAIGSTEPLGRLRGQVHHVEGVPLVATYDAPYLLRAQADKARAWEDLCRALEAARLV
ncbi:MAG: hypothetical protein V4505_11650 [Pseudomonadota bacterium]